ncbi:hypothetical protein MB27_24410 [Actinoplanes utahensis]|uniref:Uncharacterized protein n=1 Tax=Actinoplanes utahensis TaxID=1869 RepID=A0A0A6UGR4_ACTUT|nr:hypothetical protein MB27_24410 [Actinoplanes utahensis]
MQQLRTWRSAPPRRYPALPSAGRIVVAARYGRTAEHDPDACDPFTYPATSQSLQNLTAR